MRFAYRRRRDHLVATLGRESPHVRITGIAAGLHALVTLADRQDEAETVKRALDHGLVVEGLAAYSRGKQQHPPALVIGYARPPSMRSAQRLRDSAPRCASSGELGHMSL
jgi:GntR family transcriptional regulator/MocR family aminotransferase